MRPGQPAIYSFLTILFFCSSIFSQESQYRIEEFGKTVRSFSANSDEIIETFSGDALKEVKSLPVLKAGEVILRMRYGPSDYRLYHGRFASLAFDKANSLYIFKIPQEFSGKNVIHFKFYKKKVTNANLDEAKIYFDADRIYAQFLPTIFYHSGGSWKTLSADNITQKEKGSRPVGDIQISSTPPGAAIFVNGKNKGIVTPNYVEGLFSGDHEIGVELKNYQSSKKKITVKAGEIVPVSFDLISSLGSIKITSAPPGATVKMNSARMGTTPLQLTDLAAGSYSFELQKELYKNANKSILVSMNDTTKWHAILAENFGTLSLPKPPINSPYVVSTQKVSQSTIKLNPGKHRVQWDGGATYSSIDTLVTIAIGKTTTLKSFPARLTGTLKIMPLPLQTEILVNGKSQGTGAKVLRNLSTGSYTVIARADGYKLIKKRVVVNANKTETVKLILPQIPDRDGDGIEDSKDGCPDVSGLSQYNGCPKPKVSDNMVFVKGGDFMMGSNNGAADEKPVHKVFVDDFYIDKYEVSNADYCKFLNEKGNQHEGGVTWLDIKSEYCLIVKSNGRYIPKSGYRNHPVIEVTWYGARAYAKWLGKRLPTEAEWEYASRGGAKSRGYKYSGSDNVGEVGWYHKNSGGKTHPVGKKKANELGIHDMSGNVWEWCSDRYGEDYYKNSPYKNPAGPTTGDGRVLRGGSWLYPTVNLRSANRNGSNPDGRNDDSGFRCVR